MIDDEGGVVMARHGGRPRTSQRNDITVKVDRAVVGMARMVATHRGIPLAELLSEVLDVPISKAFAAMLREIEGRSR